MGDLGSVPGWGRSPGGGHGNPLQYSCLENPHGQRSLAGYSPWGLKALDMTEWLTQHSMDLYRQWGGVLPVMLRNQGNLFRGDREVWIISTIFPGNNFPGPLNWCGGLYKRKHAFGIELPRWLSGKESTCQCRRHRRHRFDLWVGKIPLKEEMATRPRILAWGITWTEEAGGLQRWSQLDRTEHEVCLWTVWYLQFLLIILISPYLPISPSINKQSPGCCKLENRWWTNIERGRFTFTQLSVYKCISLP